jgi:hypothetical protein
MRPITAASAASPAPSDLSGLLPPFLDLCHHRSSEIFFFSLCQTHAKACARTCMLTQQHKRTYNKTNAHLREYLVADRPTLTPSPPFSPPMRNTTHARQGHATSEKGAEGATRACGTTHRANRSRPLFFLASPCAAVSACAGCSAGADVAAALGRDACFAGAAAAVLTTAPSAPAAVDGAAALPPAAGAVDVAPAAAAAPPLLLLPRRDAGLDAGLGTASPAASAAPFAGSFTTFGLFSLTGTGSPAAAAAAL